MEGAFSVLYFNSRSLFKNPIKYRGIAVQNEAKLTLLWPRNEKVPWYSSTRRLEVGLKKVGPSRWTKVAYYATRAKPLWVGYSATTHWWRLLLTCHHVSCYAHMRRREREKWLKALVH